MVWPIPESVTFATAWVAIALFVAGWWLAGQRGELARQVSAAGWVVFGVFWLLMIPRFWYVMRSPIQTTLSLIAVPACVSAGYWLWTGRDSLLVLSRAVAIMGVVYLPFETMPVLQDWLIEVVAYQTVLAIGLIGFEVGLVEGTRAEIMNTLVFVTGGETYRTRIILACTGIGSMSIFIGLVGALDISLSRKLKAIGLAVAVIYVLNIVRNVFIALAYGRQWFQFYVDPIMALTGYTNPALVSFFIADRVLSQSLSVVALILIAWAVMRLVPELLTVIEDALFVVTGMEFDLYEALALDAPAQRA